LSGQISVGAQSTALSLPSTTGLVPAGTHLFATVTEVDVHLADDMGTGPTPNPAPGVQTQANDLGWATVFSGQKQLDLLDASQVGVFLGDQTVPAGRVTQVRLVLAANPTLQTATGTVAVDCPSCTETGIKVVTAGDVIVQAGATLRLTLVFDMDQSLTSNGMSFRLDPVVQLRVAEQ
jgi:hypothetical protein